VRKRDAFKTPSVPVKGAVKVAGNTAEFTLSKKKSESFRIFFPGGKKGGRGGRKGEVPALILGSDPGQTNRGETIL